MKYMKTTAKVLIVCLMLQLSLGTAAMAQQRQTQQGRKPVMENIFFNVIWGSAVGAILGVASAIISSDDKSSPEGSRQSAFTGATIGGVLGFGLGLWLVYTGTSFEGAEPEFVADQTYQPPPPHEIPAEPPLVFLTSKENPLKIVGVRATVFRMKF